MAATGFATIGSHTHTHRVLAGASATDAADEIARSVGLIEERLGRPCRHFAYPKAIAPSPAAEVVVRRHFATAALAGNVLNVAGATDLHRLGRHALTVADDDDVVPPQGGRRDAPRGVAPRSTRRRDRWHAYQRGDRVDLIVRQHRAAREAQTAPEQVVADTVRVRLAVAEHRLQVHRLPQRPALDVVCRQPGDDGIASCRVDRPRCTSAIRSSAPTARSA